MEHTFTVNIKTILEKNFPENAEEIFKNSLLLQYLNEKTRSANKGSKARGSFANLYSLYVIIEDYLKNEYHKKGDYGKYEGALFSNLFTRQRELPFGSKLQNHALNSRTNHEFRKYFPTSEYSPILHKPETKRYWINQNLLLVKIGKSKFNIAEAILQIIDEYVKTKQDAFQRFINTCLELQKIENSTPEKVQEFIMNLLAPNVDARLFEIVSYSILKFHYSDQIIIWGFNMEELNKENLKLYKTGRTNANDGGIDFVMKPLGRFFQVTETLDFKKYFLDIDKIQKYPITFVIKSDESKENIIKKIKENALKTYSIEEIVNKYMDCIEEVITISVLQDMFKSIIAQGHLNNVLNEVAAQSKVEFNYDEADELSISED